jgi:hypothetical protein
LLGDELYYKIREDEAIRVHNPCFDPLFERTVRFQVVQVSFLRLLPACCLTVACWVRSPASSSGKSRDSLTTRVCSNRVPFSRNAAPQGDLTRRQMVQGDDAIGQLSAGLQGFFANLAESIAAIAENSRTLAAASTGLTGVSEQMSITAEETSTQANVVSAADTTGPRGPSPGAPRALAVVDHDRGQPPPIATRRQPPGSLTGRVSMTIIAVMAKKQPFVLIYDPEVGNIWRLVLAHSRNLRAILDAADRRIDEGA